MHPKTSYLAYIKETYRKSILQSIQSVPCEGYFDFKAANGYAFLHVEKEFANASLTVLKDEGFSLRYMIRKNKCPGIHHI